MPIKTLLLSFLLILSVNGKSQNIYGRTKETKTQAILPKNYQAMLKQGMDVDWAGRGTHYFNNKAVADFKKMGFTHARIRVKNQTGKAFFNHLDTVINDCLHEKIIPVLASSATGFKENPTEKTLNKLVTWWETVANRYKDYPDSLSFDLIIEVGHKLNKNPEILNAFYAKAVAAIRKTNPNRIIFLSPRIRSSPKHLHELRFPAGDKYLMAEWHFYAAGPSKTNPKKQWTTGTESEKNIIRNLIKTAVNWQNKTGIYTWVGAWMPGNYNKGNNYSIPEQVAFARFVACQLDKYHIPFAINADHVYYDRQNNRWKPQYIPVLKAVLSPRCKK